MMKVNNFCSIMIRLLLPSMTLSTAVVTYNYLALSASAVVASAGAKDSENLQIPTSKNVFLTKQPSSPFLLTSSAQPYIGKWSNGRGDTLSITSNRIKFGSGKSVFYKDITRATDGSAFQINITGHGLPDGAERFMFLKIDGDKMTMTGYNSYEDMQAAQNSGSEVNWFR